jgi:hypothetical protein
MTDTRREPGFSSTARIQPPAPRRRTPVAPVVASVLALAFAAGLWFWFQRPTAPGVLPATTSPAPAAMAQAPDSAPADPSPPALLPAPAEEVLTPGDIPSALARLLGRDAVLKFLDTTDFPRRAVATLDNLGREHAPVSVWPVVPMPGRFLVAGDGTAQAVSAENAMRYRPFVALVDSIDATQAVELYRRLYPSLQQAYRELGFGDRSLHGRVLEVIDLLLATPEPLQPPAITLAEVKGPISSTSPWTRYEFVDAGLERLAAGQKILLRVGPDNRKVLKAKLGQIRRQLLGVSTREVRP